MKILCAGLIVCDLIASPVPKNIMEIDACRIHKPKLASGGDALNAAIIMSKLGAETALCGIAGDDVFGDFVLDQAAKAGVDISTVTRSGVFSTSMSIVLLEGEGERHFAYHGDSNNALSAEMILNCDLKGYRHLHVGSAMALRSLDGEGLCEVLKRAKSLGLTTSFDVTWDNEGLWLAKIEKALGYCDYFLPSLEEAKMISGCDDASGMRSFFSRFAILRLAVKMGKEGSYVTDFKDEDYVPIMDKGECIDATGAGDSYTSGFLLATLGGLDPHKSALFATAVAADNVMSYGANAGVKSLEETAAYLVANKYLTIEDVRRI